MSTELHEAAIRGDLAKMKELVEKKRYDIDALHPQDRTPCIAFAAQNGRLECVTYCLQKKR